MKSQTHVFGRMVKRYDLPLDAIEDLNNRYEARKKELASFGPRLAGRIETEREFTHILSETKISKNIVDCMNDYIETLDKVNLFKSFNPVLVAVGTVILPLVLPSKMGA